jgi:hypothetical protein
MKNIGENFLFLLFLLTCITLIRSANLKSNVFHNELSWCIADLKFNGEHVKICEFGEGIESKYKGYDYWHGEGSMWLLFWEFLQSLNIPFWYATQNQTQDTTVEHALNQCKILGGEVVKSLKHLEASPSFKNVVTTTVKQDGYNQPLGIIVLPSLSLHSSIIRTFKKKYPQCIVLGDASTEFVRSKNQTNLLFLDDLACYKPKFNVYAKKYNTMLAQTIISDIACDIFVIKPVNSSLGYGIIIVEKENLDQTLKLILHDTEQLAKFRNDHSFYYWKGEKSSHFIVEEFVSSKTVVVDGKPYDPTMRVIFSLMNNNGTISVKFFDAYWKLPVKALNQQGTLIEKHKSHIASERTSSLLVDRQDFEKVTAIMSDFLPKLYEKMLLKRHQKENMKE